MARIVKVGLIQASNPVNDESIPVAEVQEAMFQKHLPMIEKAGEAGVQILGLQEIFNGPYFCPGQDKRWYRAAEPANGPTVERLRSYARKYQMAMVVPIYEEAMPGVYYNTAVVLDADGTTLGLYRKNHIPQTSGFWEKFFFKPGNLGYPTFQTRYARIGAYICYDRHFPEGARILGLHGAEIVFNPSATVAGLSQYLWKLEQPAHAVANGYFVAASNRVGTEAPWGIGHFYGSSYVVDPRGKFLAVGSETTDDIVIADCDMDTIREVRETWQFYRDRRPDTYEDMVKQLPYFHVWAAGRRAERTCHRAAAGLGAKRLGRRGAPTGREAATRSASLPRAEPTPLHPGWFIFHRSFRSCPRRMLISPALSPAR